ncbi:MAG: hypothetical protein AAGJ35_13625, partial [Myxococcota bacterium]
FGSGWTFAKNADPPKSFKSSKSGPKTESVPAEEATLQRYRLLDVSLSLHMRFKSTERKRRVGFMVYFGRTREKNLRMLIRQAALDLNVRAVHGKGVWATGQLKVGGKSKSIALRLKNVAPRLDLHVTQTFRLGKAEAVFRWHLRYLKRWTKKSESYFKMSFQNNTLHQMFTKLGDFAQLKFDVGPGVPKKQVKTLTMDSPTRKGLIFIVCYHYRLRCRIRGNIVVVRKMKKSVKSVKSGKSVKSKK